MQKLKLTAIIMLSLVQGCWLTGKNYQAPEKNEQKVVIEEENISQAKPDGNLIRFIAVGDTGTGTESQYKVARAMEDKCKKDGCDFGLLLGDNIYNSGVVNVNDPQFITKFETPYKNLALKFYLTLGNHDYRGNVQAQVDYTKKSSKWVMPGKTYHFSKGPVEFFSVDTNEPSKKQADELEKELKASKARWKIVFGHHPRYTNGVYKNATGALAQLLDAPCGKADLYLCGHEHDKQHLKKVCGVNYLIVGTGAGLRPTNIKENTLFAKSSLGFSWFEINNSSMHFQILDTTGNIEYEYTEKK